VFVLSIDKKHLGSAVKGYYGSEHIDSNEYLRRFIDLEYSIPIPQTNLFNEEQKETIDDDSYDNEFLNATNVNYNDYGRININQKYKYEKKCHFRDTLNQYQGKQNKFIPPKLFDDLNDILEKHGLLNISEDKNIKYSKVTKEHIRLFLNEIEYSKFYEDLQLIYSKLTGKPCPDINRIEKQLYEDFDKLVEAFLSLPNMDRKNFLNSHYVLRQLLLRKNIKVKLFKIILICE
jgi:hypothetical protein